jgi:hypothetical protein
MRFWCLCLLFCSGLLGCWRSSEAVPTRHPGLRPSYAWLSASRTNRYEPLSRRFAPPRGYKRVALKSRGFGFWLRHLPLEAKGTPVKLHNGRLRSTQSSHAAVVHLDIGRGNLQQCADAVMRLWTEYLWVTRQRSRIGFRFTSGHWYPWTAWRRGFRPRIVRGRMKGWRRGKRRPRSYRSYRRYLRTIMMYAGTWSLTKELPRVSHSRLQPGDVLLQGGFPGHAVLILDKAVNRRGKAVYLLGQSYMPAQSFHVLRGKGNSPWRTLPSRGRVLTPDWTFPKSTYYRLPPRKGRFTGR